MREIDDFVTGARAYTGEVRFRFSGDAYAAQRYIPMARVVVGGVIARAKLSYLYNPNGPVWGRQTLPNGVQIIVSGLNGAYTAEIQAPGNSPRVPPRTEGPPMPVEVEIPLSPVVAGTIAVGTVLIGSTYRPAVWLNGRLHDMELLTPFANGELRAIAKDGSRAVGSRLTAVGAEATYDRESYVWTPGKVEIVTGTDPKEFMAGVSNDGDMVSGHTHAEYLVQLGAFVRRDNKFNIVYQQPVGIFGGNFIETADMAISPNGRYMASVFSTSADPGLMGGGPRFDVYPYVWIDGVGPTLLSNTGPSWSAIGGVNDRGVVVGSVLGTSAGASWGGEAVSWDAVSGDRRSLGKGVAMGVGDSAIVGYWGNGPSLGAIATAWYMSSAGQVELPGTNAKATCVTRDGRAIGGYVSGSTFGFAPPFTPVIWAGGIMTELELPAGSSNGIVYDIASLV